jgi:hypothetical protein
MGRKLYVLHYDLKKIKSQIKQLTDSKYIFRQIILSQKSYFRLKKRSGSSFIGPLVL